MITKKAENMFSRKNEDELHKCSRSAVAIFVETFGSPSVFFCARYSSLFHIQVGRCWQYISQSPCCFLEVNTQLSKVFLVISITFFLHKRLFRVCQDISFFLARVPISFSYQQHYCWRMSSLLFLIVCSNLSAKLLSRDSQSMIYIYIPSPFVFVPIPIHVYIYACINRDLHLDRK